MKYRFLSSIVALTIALAACEGVLRMLRVRDMPSSAQRFFVWPPYTTRTFHPSSERVPGVEGPTRFTTDKYGFRAARIDQNGRLYRILAVGGSATECLYLDDDRAWPALLERRLGATADGRRVWIANAGLSGTNSRDHVFQLAALVNQAPHFDLVLVMAGANDLSVALAGIDRAGDPPLDHPNASQIHTRRSFNRSPAEATGRWEHLRLFILLRQARDAFMFSGVSETEDGAMYDKWRGFRQHAAQQIQELPDLSPALAEYRDALNRLVRIVRSSGSPIVLLTQPAMWQDNLPADRLRLLWMGGKGRFQIEQLAAYYSPGALARGLAAFNRVTLDVCRDEGVACVDLAPAISTHLDAFYDDVHFTDAGARLGADAIAPAIQQQAPFSERGY